jgi:hypothetical protein
MAVSLQSSPALDDGPIPVIPNRTDVQGGPGSRPGSCFFCGARYQGADAPVALAVVLGHLVECTELCGRRDAGKARAR